MVLCLSKHWELVLVLHLPRRGPLLYPFPPAANPAVEENELETLLHGCLDHRDALRRHLLDHHAESSTARVTSRWA